MNLNMNSIEFYSQSHPKNFGQQAGLPCVSFAHKNIPPTVQASNTPLPLDSLHVTSYDSLKLDLNYNPIEKTPSAFCGNAVLEPTVYPGITLPLSPAPLCSDLRDVAFFLLQDITASFVKCYIILEASCNPMLPLLLRDCFADFLIIIIGSWRKVMVSTNFSDDNWLACSGACIFGMTMLSSLQNICNALWSNLFMDSVLAERVVAFTDRLMKFYVKYSVKDSNLAVQMTTYFYLYVEERNAWQNAAGHLFSGLLQLVQFSNSSHFTALRGGATLILNSLLSTSGMYLIEQRNDFIGNSIYEPTGDGDLTRVTNCSTDTSNSLMTNTREDYRYQFNGYIGK